MQKRLHLKKKYFISFKKKSNLIILVVIGFIISLSYLFSFINQKFTPLIMDYAEMQAGRIATLVINQAINNEVTNEIDLDDLFIIIKDENDQIKSMDFNPLSVNKMLSLVTNNVQVYLRKLESGKIEEIGLTSSSYDNKIEDGIIFEIPSGIIFGNSILNNIGPKIPVRISLVGDIISNVNTEVTSYGINNALIKINIDISVVEQVILPFTSKKITVSTNVPVAIKLVQGDIPHYYLNGEVSNSKVLSIPVE